MLPRVSGVRPWICSHLHVLRQPEVEVSQESHRQALGDRCAFEGINGEGEGAHAKASSQPRWTYYRTSSFADLARRWQLPSVRREIAQLSLGRVGCRVLESFKGVHQGVRGKHDSSDGPKSRKASAYS